MNVVVKFVLAIIIIVLSLLVLGLLILVAALSHGLLHTALQKITAVVYAIPGL